MEYSNSNKIQSVKKDLISRREFTKIAALTGMSSFVALSGCTPSDATDKVQATHVQADPDANVQGASSVAADTELYTSIFPTHQPLGVGRGTVSGRVAWVRDGESVNWDGSSQWWESCNFDNQTILAAMREVVCIVAGKDDPATAWDALFQHHNSEHNRNGGYAQDQKIAIKCNMNGAGTYGTDAETNLSYTAPVALWALLKTLVEDAGVAPDCITAADPCRIFPEHVMELCSEGNLAGVHFAHYEPGSERDAKADTTAPLNWSGTVNGETSYVPTCFTEADYVVNLASLKGHEWGLTLSAKNHYGTVMNSDRLRPPQAAGLHSFVSNPTRDSYTALVDLLGNVHLDGKCVLWMLEALIVSENNAAPVTRSGSLWEGYPYEGGFTASILASQDPVALDSVGADILVSQPTIMDANPVLSGKPNVEAYLHEAALADSAPSGIAYQDGAGNRLRSLGVHEHWNNSNDMQYSKNLGADGGIELVTSFR